MLTPPQFQPQMLFMSTFSMPLCEMCVPLFLSIFCHFKSASRWVLWTLCYGSSSSSSSSGDKNGLWGLCAEHMPTPGSSLGFPWFPSGFLGASCMGSSNLFSVAWSMACGAPRTGAVQWKAAKPTSMSRACSSYLVPRSTESKIFFPAKHCPSQFYVVPMAQKKTVPWHKKCFLCLERKTGGLKWPFMPYLVCLGTLAYMGLMFNLVTIWRNFKFAQLLTSYIGPPKRCSDSTGKKSGLIKAFYFFPLWWIKANWR